MSTRRRFLATSLASTGFPILGGAAGAASAYARRVLDKKPVGYWRLGEKAGPRIADASGQAHDGTAVGAVLFGQKGMLDREGDGAAAFDGKSACIEIPDSAAFSLPTSGAGLTVEVWMRPDVIDFTGEGEEGYIHWLGKGEAGKQEWAFRFYPAKSSRPSRISAYAFNSGPGLGSGAYIEEPVKPGKWMHITATFDPGDASDPKAGVSIYKDGKLVGSPATQPGALYKAYEVKPAHGNAPLRFGTRDLKSFFAGALDEIAIYPRVLSSREVAENHRAGRAG